MTTALTIAGSDSGGGAGVQADLKTFAAHGVYGLSAVTAVTAQNSLAVSAIHPVPAPVVASQIAAVVTDFGAQAVKTGMLLEAAIVEAVAASLAEFKLPNLVVDPVLIASSGAALLDADGVSALRTRLLPLARVVTPNRPEAERLTGRAIASTGEAADAARRIRDMGPAAVILTGGHLRGDTVVDILYDGVELFELRGTRVETAHSHGTGCTFAAAVAAGLALGRALPEAARSAKRYVEQGLRRAPGLGRGSGPLAHCRPV
ncbi:MAG: bifunctional hydroxymethylpyrimidine kinase/phosphomethylpyrimidine kinase [Acidobacteria bacterium]|nr:bifunctional hydroxymethylpyrimidine kinase/phosphomethylpyrimidine kinase [Acidobacteriota bacterium]